MIEQNEIGEIKRLIEKGFDLELISSELDISFEELKKIKIEMEEENQKNKKLKTFSARELIDKENKQTRFRMEKMRQRYRSVFLGNNEEEVISYKELSQQEHELIDATITEIEEIINEMKDMSKKEKRKNAWEIVMKIEEIQDYQLTIEQSKKLCFLLKSDELNRLGLTHTDRIDSILNRKRSIIVKKMAESTNFVQMKTENIEELDMLRKDLMLMIDRETPMNVSSVKSKIDNKILKIQTKMAIDRVRNDIPVNIEAIITDLSKGTLDIEKANEIIEEEARKRLEGKQRAKFSLSTEEQEKKQILMQIKTVMMEKVDKYCIESPESTVVQLQELYGGDLEQSVRIVVGNLIASKNFQKAKLIYDKFYGKNKNALDSKRCTILRNEIRNAEISDMVLRVINMNGTIEEERVCFELIEKGIDMGNVKLGSISLGKSKDGLRNISLADVWEDDDREQRQCN